MSAVDIILSERPRLTTQGIRVADEETRGRLAALRAREGLANNIELANRALELYAWLSEQSVVGPIDVVCKRDDILSHRFQIFEKKAA